MPRRRFVRYAVTMLPQASKSLGKPTRLLLKGLHRNYLIALTVAEVFREAHRYVHSAAAKC